MLWAGGGGLGLAGLRAMLLSGDWGLAFGLLVAIRLAWALELHQNSPMR